MDNLFLQQVHGDNLQMLEELEQSEEPNGQIYIDFFKNMFGPWNRLDEDHPYINTAEKPLGANYYPADITQKEFDDWLPQFEFHGIGDEAMQAVAKTMSRIGPEAQEKIRVKILQESEEELDDLREELEDLREELEELREELKQKTKGM